MLKYYEGTVFNTKAKTLVNTVNCFGVMGAGVALEFKLRYPEMFIQYEQMCKDKKYKVGRPRLHSVDGIQILNFPTKNHWKNPSKIEWIEEGLRYFADNYKKVNITSIAFPKLGTSNGGLKWDDVKPLMEKYLKDLEDIDVIICLDELKNAEGIELQMVNELNKIGMEELNTKLKLKAKQKIVIEQELPIDRFWKLSRLEGIGSKTYEKIFNYFYDKYNIKDDKKISNINEQLSFFER